MAYTHAYDAQWAKMVIKWPSRWPSTEYLAVMNFSIPWSYTKEKKAKSKYIDTEIFTLPSILILIHYDPNQRPQLEKKYGNKDT